MSISSEQQKVDRKKFNENWERVFGDTEPSVPDETDDDESQEDT
jgi:hypothetical protein